MSPSTLSTASQLVIAAIWLLPLSPNFCTAWTIAPDCAAFPQVSAEMTGALNLAIYAKMRAANDPPRLGTSMADLLAAPNENDSGNLQLVQTWFQNVVDAASIPSPGGVVIHCFDAHLTPTDPANGKYIDTERSNTLVNAPRPAGTTPTNNACGGVVKAFTYAAGGQQVIVLCSDSDKGALKSSLTSLEQWRTSGNLKNEELVQEKGLDVLGIYLSTMILHELMHAASFAEQAKALQPAQFPGILPDKVNNQPVGELYQYTPISGKKLGDQTSSGQSTANNLQHNADSFSLLAASTDS
ncbi:hypothetical protein BDZ45DRAFT_754768 [Acephala macrosclerotiorum]|nr:hypothetical protein BDZ45DRAFT_754768 [Acephala macrosclerotiorum]